MASVVDKMSLCMRKPTIWGSDQVQHKPGCTVTEDGSRLKILNCTIHVAKTKAPISFALTAKLVCTFVFAYADCWFSDAAAQIENFDFHYQWKVMGVFCWLPCLSSPVNS